MICVVRPAFTKSFWTKSGTIDSSWSSSRGPSKPRSIPINNNSGHDAFEMGKTARRQRSDYNVTILSMKGTGGDSDSTDRMYEGGIMVNTFVDVESESVVRGSSSAGVAGQGHHGNVGFGSPY